MQIRQDLYFVSPHKTRPSLFGLPLLAPLLWVVDPDDETNMFLQTSCQDLYRCVWTLVSRLVSPSPPTDNGTLPNHAHDWYSPRPILFVSISVFAKTDFYSVFYFSDDSLGYEFPFTLKVVQPNGIYCGLCPWTKFCKGCPLPPTAVRLPFGPENCSSSFAEGAPNYCIAVDWEPTALHLRYQTSLEKVRKSESHH